MWFLLVLDLSLFLLDTAVLLWLNVYSALLEIGFFLWGCLMGLYVVLDVLHCEIWIKVGCLFTLTKFGSLRFSNAYPLFQLFLNLHKLCLWRNIGFVINHPWLVRLEYSEGLYASEAFYGFLRVNFLVRPEKKKMKE
jgi:hypothetical protein